MREGTLVNSKTRRSIDYRPEIDGLRGVAVIAVVLYHMRLSFPGGYVGVDVFFVISGYLITSIILSDLRRGVFKMSNFWVRRIKRILPASVVCIILVLSASWFLLLPDDLEALGASAIAHGFSIANVYFWRTTNYFDGGNSEKPLLHTWSLSVEEQFYLLLPVCLFMISSARSWLTKKIFLGAGVLVAILSLGAAAWGVFNQPFATFFLLPTRIWELLLGAFLARSTCCALVCGALFHSLCSWSGMCLVIMPCFFYSDDTPFPGFGAIPPCLGTALIIWGTQRVSSRNEVGLLVRVLSFRWLRFIGVISYSLYLYHWPLIAFSEYWGAAPHHLTFRCGLVLSALILAILSWRFVETPLRNWNNYRHPKGVFFSAGFCLLAIVSIGFGFWVKDGFPARLDATEFQIYQGIRNERVARNEAYLLSPNIVSLGKVEANDVPLVGVRSRVSYEDEISFVVVGDSHAQIAAKVLDSVALEFGLTGAMLTHTGTPPLVDWPYFSAQASKSPHQFFDSAVDFVKRNRVPDVYLMAFWSGYRNGLSADEFSGYIEKTASAFIDAGARVHLVADVPTYDVNVPRMQLRRSFVPFLRDSFQSQSIELYHSFQEGVFSFKGSEEIDLIDPTSRLLDESSGLMLVSEGSTQFYNDKDHLSQVGAVHVWEPIFREVFQGLLRR